MLCQHIISHICNTSTRCSCVNILSDNINFSINVCECHCVASGVMLALHTSVNIRNIAQIV